jgi:transcriptional regulator GlxA family with amidase domain
MQTVAIITLPGFNEIDSFIAFHILNRASGLKAFLAGPEPEPRSGNGVRVTVEGSLADANRANAVIVGSGRRTAEFAADPAFLAALDLDPERQIVASQCSGALVLAAKGLLDGQPVCTDRFTRPRIEEQGLTVIDETLHAAGNIVTAGGCLGAIRLSHYLLEHLLGREEADAALAYVLPVGEADMMRDWATGRL